MNRFQKWLIKKLGGYTELLAVVTREQAAWKGNMATAYISKDEAIKSAIDACTEILGRGITQFEAVRVANIMEKIPDADVVTVDLAMLCAIQVAIEEVRDHRKKIGLDPVGFNPTEVWANDLAEYIRKNLRIARTQELEEEDEQ